MNLPPLSRFKRLVSEEQFASTLSWPTVTIPPMGPADYPTLSAGDLAVTQHRGSFIRPCPATPRYNCCGLNIFHFGQGCDLGCMYCILSAYLGSEAVILFGNVADGLAELEGRLALMSSSNFTPPPGSPVPSNRFCTGEFTDSLLLDEETKLSEKLIALFRDRPPFFLELKTKTARIDHLLDLDHAGRTVISFSVNAPQICCQEEPLAASLLDRLSAAARAANKGYPVGLHFDPLIYHPNWEKGYEQTCHLIAEHLAPESVAWVSLGCFRYLPALKPIMLRSRPSSLFDAEFIRGGDGKMRYPRPLRQHIYRTVLDFLRPKIGPQTKVYLCMESGRVWREVFGYDPGTAGLTSMFS
ncbi:MAG: DNA photolyase [Deltaproteobacteria bacterium]|jgi:spore photoproduct lyase|nr:DNA photolyase [Deltaproteobacteria bacterium]